MSFIRSINESIIMRSCCFSSFLHEKQTGFICQSLLMVCTACKPATFALQLFLDCCCILQDAKQAKKEARKEARKEAEPKKADEASIDMLDIR